ncbi:hypothetical protein [Nostoc sp. PCC 7524]|nr:hypothetical protein [Nostoc sp. PCC 7524]
MLTESLQVKVGNASLYLSTGNDYPNMTMMCDRSCTGSNPKG